MDKDLGGGLAFQDPRRCVDDSDESRFFLQLSFCVEIPKIDQSLLDI